MPSVVFISPNFVLIKTAVAFIAFIEALSWDSGTFMAFPMAVCIVATRVEVEILTTNAPDPVDSTIGADASDIALRYVVVPYGVYPDVVVETLCE